MRQNKRNYYHHSQMAFDFDVINQDVFITADMENISFMLPRLFPSQHEDVCTAEKRFEVGKGMMFTNGTGTGKTYVGLGIAYRFYKRDLQNILIVVPTETKCNDWIEDGAYVGLTVTALNGTSDEGNGVVVTTYANFYQNNALESRIWDLVIYDESHYLNQNLKGSDTVYVEKHKKVANLPSAAYTKAMDLIPMRRPDYDSTQDYYDKLQLYNELLNNKTEELVNATKVVFLSATPFAYHKSIIYADGCLFDINEKLQKEAEKYLGYNESNDYQNFMISNFGYKMKYNKLTVPDSGVDMNLMERNFFENLKQKGVISTRILELEYDYSRHFITVDSTIGDKINKGMELFYDEEFRKEFPIMCLVKNKKYNYNYINQLLECVKAKEIYARIQQHIDLGRKVVIFHSYNNSAVEHPFQFNAYNMLNADELFRTPALEKEIEKFKIKYSEYWNMDLSELKNTRDAIIDHFPKAKQFNGTISKNLRKKHIEDFNNDYGYTKKIIVQQKAGKEGISMHDKTGKYPRVLIQLGLPTEPTTAIQIEGRTYRQGLMSNAVYEYITLQTNFERIAFGTKIAERSRTAENLAMGNLARNLENSFKEGYIESSYEPPSLEQGTGGKEMDKFDNSISEFDKAKTYYYGRAKRNSKNKSKEGADYFATPEPLGMKMVEWLDPKPDERGMEPSAGHGAISRWFPAFCNNHFIEPSLNLSSEVSINSTGQLRIGTFESHSSVNKYDFIAMNPPFGIAGKIAMEHITKAVLRHSSHRFRLISIIPCGPSMDKRLEEFFNSEHGRNYIMLWQIRLPSCTFERAGTSVSCKVIKIVTRYREHEHYTPKRIDLSYHKTIEEFFEAIEHLEM